MYIHDMYTEKIKQDKNKIVSLISTIWLAGDIFRTCGEMGNNVNPDQNAVSDMYLHY